MSKSSRPQGGVRAGRAKVDELRLEQRAKERRSRIILVAAVSAVVLLIAGIVGFTVYNDVSNRPTLDAVKTYTVTRDHTSDPVTYAQTITYGLLTAAISKTDMTGGIEAWALQVDLSTPRY